MCLPDLLLSREKVSNVLKQPQEAPPGLFNPLIKSGIILFYSCLLAFFPLFCIISYFPCVWWWWWGSIFGKENFHQCQSTCLDRKLTIKLCYYFYSLNFSVLIIYTQILFYDYIIKMGILYDVFYLVKSETAILVAEKARKCIYFVIHGTLHIEIHHLQG